MEHACTIDNSTGCVYNKNFNNLIVYIKNEWFQSNYCPFCGYSIQPERLSEEARKGCDSPNTPTKGSESTRNE